MSTRSIFPGITIPKISIPKISIPRTTIPRISISQTTIPRISILGPQSPGPQFPRLHHPVTFSHIQLHSVISDYIPVVSDYIQHIRLHSVISSHIRLHPVISPLCLNYLAGHVWIVCDDGVHMSSLTHLYILRSINGPHIQGKALSLRLLDESRELQVI